MASSYESPVGGGFNAAKNLRPVSHHAPPPPPSGSSPKNSNGKKKSIGGYTIDEDENDFTNYQRNNKVSDLDARINALMSSPTKPSPKKIAPLSSAPATKTTTNNSKNNSNNNSNSNGKGPSSWICPQCNRSDFPSKVLWRSHCRRCRKKDEAEQLLNTLPPPSPSSKDAKDNSKEGKRKGKGNSMGIGGFGKMSLLSQLRKMEQADDLQRRQAAQRAIEEEKTRAALQIEEEKEEKRNEQKRANERYDISVNILTSPIQTNGTLSTFLVTFFFSLHFFCTFLNLKYSKIGLNFVLESNFFVLIFLPFFQFRPEMLKNKNLIVTH